ncbi:MAG: phosphoribosyltransferase family protein [Ruminococcus sp.]|nr:phosphoribosyltransferase family protein [Ruminococcus sp.]
MREEYTVEQLARPALRENNSKRKNLLVNFYQAKHIPAVPSRTLKLFGSLAALADTGDCAAEEIMVIAFAETATAIGAATAAYLGGCVFMHTSREDIPEKYRIADFSEEHSHASEQFLFSRSGRDIFKGIKHIILTEDELTTGKTMLSLINILRKMTDGDCRFTALSIIGGMDADRLGIFEREGIAVRCLARLDGSLGLMNREMSITPLPDSPPVMICTDIVRREIGGMSDPRLGVLSADYLEACGDMISRAMEMLAPFIGEDFSADVIGTEECMYPAVMLGYRLETLGCDVRSHSVTRSPIVPAEGEDYPIYERHRLVSFYDARRTVYIYDLYPCDMTVLLTDSADIPPEAEERLAQAVRSERLVIIQWKGQG